jgi:broad specificity phosphatase PhoE
MSGTAHPKSGLTSSRASSDTRQGTGPTRLLVARHGQSEWNAAGRWQGQADPPLSEFGQLQAAEAALHLGIFDAIWASDLQRAALTAAIIAEIIGIGPIQIDKRLRETDVGPWEGLTHAQVEQGWPGYLESHQRPEGFENYDEAAGRMIESFIQIAAQTPGGEVLIVSHGGAIRAVRRLLGATDERMPNLGACWFSVDGAQIEAGEFVRLIDAALPDGTL